MKRLITCLLLAASAFLCSCGGSDGPGSALNPVAQNSGQTEHSQEQIAAGLPSLSELNESERTVSIAGPGWTNLDLNYRSFTGLEAGVTDEDGFITMAGLGSMAFATFGLHGFDGDNYPTGLRADVSDLTGEFFLAHGDYVTGRWQIAGPFTDSTTYEYPEVTDFSNPDNLVSGRRNHFVAILVPDGSSLQLNNLAVGVHGGNDGPAPIIVMHDRSSESRLVLSWPHSASFNDPDFAGYRVERGLFPAGSLVRLGDENIYSDWFEDDSAELDVLYYYRIIAEDTSGNQANAFNFPAARLTASASAPVCDAKLPKGPLTGPVKVRLDLSGSFDADGDPMELYEFDLGFGNEEIQQLDPVLEIDLQPGCYKITLGAKAAGKWGYSRHELKVYPSWNEQSYPVNAAAPALTTRANYPRSFFDPQSGRAVCIYTDPAIPAVVSLAIDAAGNKSWSTLPIGSGNEFAVCSEPAYVNGNWVFALSSDFFSSIIRWNSSGMEYIFGKGRNVNSSNSAVVSDGAGNIWLLYHELNLDYDLRAWNINTNVDVVVVAALNDPRHFDAEWNAEAQAIDIVYSGDGATGWARWSPLSGPAGAFALLPLDAARVDVEQNPATGRPTVIMHDGSVFQYSELSADNLTWTVPTAIDDAFLFYPRGTLIHRGGESYVYCGRNPGNSLLYRKNGAAWQIVNNALFPEGGAYSSFCFIPGTPGFFVFDSALAGPFVAALMQTDDSEVILHEGLGWRLQGIELSAAASGTDIHCIQKYMGNYVHFSSADGETWTELADAGFGDGGKLAGDQNGDVYASLINGGNVYLRRWSNPGWVDPLDNPISPGTLPLIYGQGQALEFENFNEGAVPAEYYLSSNAGPVNIINPDRLPIWDGAIVARKGNASSTLVRYDSPNFGMSGKQGILNRNSGEIEFLFDDIWTVYGDTYARGRHFEGSYFGRNFADPSTVFYCAYGPEDGPCRVTQGPGINQWQTESFEAPLPEYDPRATRRTVSAALAWGDTSVGLIANLTGDYTIFEWDNFGDFENLPLPAGLEHASMHELVVGPDGRWHILYRDWFEDELRVISTVN
jgi:hypothetical protein